MNSLFKIRSFFNIAKGLIVVIFFVLLNGSCDKIKQPNPFEGYACVLDTHVVKTNASSNLNTRKILLEDYTGHMCGNCPRAARRAETLIGSYGNQVVVIANHVSITYAKPESDTTYREDFRNSNSTAWDLAFGMSSAGLPKGMVNRTTPYAQGDAAWSSVVATELGKPQSARLEITSVYDTLQRLLNVKVKTTFLQNINANVMLSVVVTQDSIIGDQKDYLAPSGVIVKDDDLRPDYLFEHLVIGSMNGDWGNLVKASPAANDEVTLNNDCYVLKKCYYKSLVCVNDRHVNVVAFVYRDDTKEVLQAEKLKIR